MLKAKFDALGFHALSIEEYGSWGGEGNDFSRHLTRLNNRAATMFGLGPHANLNIAVQGFTNDLVHLGYNVLATDVDQVWQSNPLPILESIGSTEGRDIVVLNEGRNVGICKEGIGKGE